MVILSVELMGSEKVQNGVVNAVDLVYINGKTRHIFAYGVDKISKSMGNQDASSLQAFFPHLTTEVFTIKVMI